MTLGGFSSAYSFFLDKYVFFRQYHIVTLCVYACTDAAVARCGSNSANELIALKIPTLFIPLQNKRSRGDQVKNAEYFYKEGLCRVLREKQLTPQTLRDEVFNLFKDENLKTALAASAVECGNKRIVNEIKACLKV